MIMTRQAQPLTHRHKQTHHVNSNHVNPSRDDLPLKTARKRPPSSSSTKTNCHRTLPTWLEKLGVILRNLLPANKSKRSLWMFVFVFCLCIGHYTVWLPRILGPTTELGITSSLNVVDTPNNHDASITTSLTTSTRTSQSIFSSFWASLWNKFNFFASSYTPPHPQRGLMACLEYDDNDETVLRQSILQILVLVDQLAHDFDTFARENTTQQYPSNQQNNRNQDWVLEIYHFGQLSRYLQAHLESYRFVTLVDLTWNSPEPSSSMDACWQQAVQTTLLKTAIAIPPRVHLLENPLILLEKYEPKCTCQPCILGGDGVNQLAASVKNKRICAVSPLEEQGNIVQNSKFHQSRLQPVPAFVYGTATELWWMQLSSDYVQIVTDDDVFMPETATQNFDYVPSHGKEASPKPPHIQAMQSYWHRQWTARRTLLMDRPSINWVAFDAGYHAHLATLNSLQAALTSLQHYHPKVLNLDIALTADGDLVAVHNDKSITPAQFKGSQLSQSIHTMTTQRALQLTSPCFPQEIVHNSLLPNNPYRPYHCQPEPVALLQPFIQLIQQVDQQYRSHATELILDLKAPSEAFQIEQAKILAKTIVHELRQHQQVAVRFFDVVPDEDRLAATVFPQHAFAAMTTDPALRDLGYYANVPTAVACHQMNAWIQNSTSIINKNLNGCYVIRHHGGIAKSWHEFVSLHNIDTFNIPEPTKGTPSTRALKVICDVPRKQSFQDPSLWGKEYVSCVQDGFDYIHDPFPPALKANTQKLPLLSTKRIPEMRQRTQTMLETFMTPKNTTRKPARRRTVVSYWGYGSAFDFDDTRQDNSLQDMWFAGNEYLPLGRYNMSFSMKDRNFRCVSKVMTILLFLKFQEMGLVHLDDFVVENNNFTHSMTWRHIFTNTARATNTTPIGTSFVYENAFWYPVPSGLEKVSGMRFVDAIRQYVLDPMGLEGFYDDTNTTFPPYGGRGYNGYFSDLMIIGGTLAARGVSPKTRKQIVSAESVNIMLENSMTTPELQAAFEKDKLVGEMERVYNIAGLFPWHFVRGYGMGVWNVQWRTNSQGQPIHGWLAQGSGFTYFDNTGLVLSFKTKGPFPASIVRAFASGVAELGDSIRDGQLASLASSPLPNTLFANVSSSLSKVMVLAPMSNRTVPAPQPRYRTPREQELLRQRYVRNTRYNRNDQTTARNNNRNGRQGNNNQGRKKRGMKKNMKKKQKQAATTEGNPPLDQMQDNQKQGTILPAAALAAARGLEPVATADAEAAQADGTSQMATTTDAPLSAAPDKKKNKKKKKMKRKASPVTTDATAMVTDRTAQVPETNELPVTTDATGSAVGETALVQAINADVPPQETTDRQDTTSDGTIQAANAHVTPQETAAKQETATGETIQVQNAVTDVTPQENSDKQDKRKRMKRRKRRDQ